MSQQINLYPASLRPRHELATARNFAVCTLLVLVAMTALAVWTRMEANRKMSAAVSIQKQLTDAKVQLTAQTKIAAERKVSPALVAEQDSAKALLATRREVMTVLDSGKLGNTLGFSAIMTGFARQTQTHLWLTGFAVTLGGEEIEIRGRTLDPGKLPVYVQDLSGEPVFQGRRFAALEMRGVDPEEQKATAPGVAPASDQPKLPHFVEFVLRSENAVAAGGAKP